MRDLEKLRDEKPWLNNKIKFHYIRISDILRVYIENRFKTPALEQTTEEILGSLKSPVCETTELNRLSAILKLADLVKFAKVIPDTEENALQIDKAGEFVRNTSVHHEPEVTTAGSETVLDQSKISS